MNQINNGKIYLILGPMYSGKTSELIRRYNRYIISGKNSLLVKSVIDNRYDIQSLCTHDLHKINAVSCKKLSNLENLEDYDVICIDEIQFYEDNIEFIETMANQGKIIVASGLSGNYKRQPFQNIPQLSALADNIIYLTAICMICKSEGAAFTKRISSESAEVLVGSVEEYLAVCRKCYFK